MYSAQFLHLKSNKQNRAVDMALGCRPGPTASSAVIVPRWARMPTVKLPRACTSGNGRFTHGVSVCVQIRSSRDAVQAGFLSSRVDGGSPVERSSLGPMGCSGTASGHRRCSCSCEKAAAVTLVGLEVIFYVHARLP